MADILDRLPDAVAAVARSLDDSAVESWSTTLAPPMRSSGITTPRRVAAFLGQVSHESAGFAVMEENLHYTAARLCQVWPARFVIPTSALCRRCAGNPEALANEVYGGRLGNVRQGDGWLFHGRGLIQLTGRVNYQAFATAVGRHVDDMPAYLATPAGAAASACWFWTSHALNGLADSWAITAATVRISGGTNGLPQRIELCNAALAVLGGSV